MRKKVYSLKEKALYFLRRGGILKELIKDRQKLNGEITRNRPQCCDTVEARRTAQMSGFIKEKYFSYLA